MHFYKQTYAAAQTQTTIPMFKHDFFDHIRYNRPFKKVLHKGGEYAINYIKIFHNTKDLVISVRNCYYGD